MSGYSANQTSTFRRRESEGHEQSWHQTTGHTVANTEADPKADFGVSLQEHNGSLETTNSMVITPEDLDRISREYNEPINETYRPSTSSNHRHRRLFVVSR